MDFDLSDDHRMIKELVRRFVTDKLIPLEATVLAREASGQSTTLTEEEQAPIDASSRALGLWGLDAPEDVGGVDLPAVAMVGVNEEMGRTIVPYTLPPDSPNLRMLAAMLYVLGKAVPLLGARPAQRGARLAAALKQDDAACRPFRGELERLEENGLALLGEWPWDAAGVLQRWVQGVLQAARAAAAAKADDADV